MEPQEPALIRAEVRREISRNWSNRLRGATSAGLLGALCAAALAPVLLAATGAGVVLVAGAGVLGSVGANLLSNVIAQVIDRLRASGRRPTGEEVGREVAAAIEQALAGGDSRARQLRQEVAAVLRETGTVGMALEEIARADPAAQAELTRAIIALGVEFEDHRSQCQLEDYGLPLEGADSRVHLRPRRRVGPRPPGGHGGSGR